MAKIGVFDAGLGGIAVLGNIIRRLPMYDYVYLTDNVRSSYSASTDQEVYDLTQKAVTFLFSQDCDLVLLASMTATALALHKLQEDLSVSYPEKHVLGGIVPVAQVAAMRTYSGNIGVMGSEGVVRSAVFATELYKLRSGVRVYQEACPMLLPLIETGQVDGEALHMTLRSYLAPLQAAAIDTLILGSSHYGPIRQQVSAILGPHVQVIEEGPILSEKLAEYLSMHSEIEKQLTRSGERTFYATSKKSFDMLASQLYGSQVEGMHVTL